MSNASSDMYDKNTFNFFTNLFPQNLDLKNREWEIGIVSIGIHYNYNLLTLPKNQPGIIVLKNELTSINFSETDIKFEVLDDRLKSTWFLPELSESKLSVDNLMINLKTFIYTEGMRMRHFKDNVDGEEKLYYTIDERPKRENEDYNDNKYLLIHQHLIKILKLRCYQNGAKFSQTKTIELFGEKYLYFPLKKNFKFQTIVNRMCG